MNQGNVGWSKERASFKWWPRLVFLTVLVAVVVTVVITNRAPHHEQSRTEEVDPAKPTDRSPIDASPPDVANVKIPTELQKYFDEMPPDTKQFIAGLPAETREYLLRVQKAKAQVEAEKTEMRAKTASICDTRGLSQLSTMLITGNCSLLTKMAADDVAWGTSDALKRRREYALHSDSEWEGLDPALRQELVQQYQKLLSSGASTTSLPH